jgi:saccharopine dehydrogenase (NAD+, L-lysine forming)
MKRLGVQAVVGQTAFGAVIGMDLLQSGTWKSSGVFGPEAFDAVPYLEKMKAYDFPYSIMEM